jgi:hypothetical protein
VKAQTPVSIKLTPAQRARILEASGKDVSELSIEPEGTGSGFLYAAFDGKEFWLLKHPDPESYLTARGKHQPRIVPRYACFRLRIGESRIHHLGVFAEERISARRKVIEYVGERINPIETYRRLNDEKATYIVWLNRLWTVDGSVGGSGAEFINHSCDPNLLWRRFMGHVHCVSFRTIEAGEELTLDYHFPSTAAKVPCLCGSPKCRGTINIDQGRQSRLRIEEREGNT